VHPKVNDLDSFFAPSNQGLPLTKNAPASKHLWLGTTTASSKHVPVDFAAAVEQQLRFDSGGAPVQTLAQGLQHSAPYVPPTSVLQLMTFYEVLGVAPTVVADEISKAYRKLALTFHPDKRGSALSVSEEAYFKVITKAHETLIDPVARKQYDVSLTSSNPGSLFDHM